MTDHHPSPTPSSPSSSYDVIIFGGAFSGSSLALLLKRTRPSTRILIIEKSEAFDRKVGESTSEVAGCFLTRILGLSNHLAGEHFQKHGLRMWFNQPGNTQADRCSEIGPFSQARLPTYQLDRSKLDLFLLETARKAGCEVWRPATVKSFELLGQGNNRVTVKYQGETHTVSAAWIADCSGKASLIARHRGTWRKLDAHPVHSMWVRFRNVRCLDCHETRTLSQAFQNGPTVARAAATNHLMGHGWWSWIIPLSNGDFSAGVTWDERIFTPPSAGSIGDRVKHHLLQHPIGHLMFENASPVENDARTYKHLPYYSTEVCGDGWILAGDSAGFMDPLYSQGLDYCAHASYSAFKIISQALNGHCVRERLLQHNQEYPESYQRWFHGIYRNKYQYLGDSDLMRAAFLLDVAAYFIGPVRLVYTHPDNEFAKMPYNGPVGAAFARLMACYNRRLETIARKRLAAGTYGKNNLDQRYFIRTPFEPNTKAVGHFLRGLRAWLKLEISSIFLRPSPALADPSSSDLHHQTAKTTAPLTPVA